MNRKRSYCKSIKGFALLYALLVTTITLSAGLLVSSIITRQFKTSNIAARGFTAFASSIDGNTCAQFWDRWYKSEQGKANGLLDLPEGTINQKCSGQDIVLSTPSSGILVCAGKTSIKEFTLFLSPTSRAAGGALKDPWVKVQVCYTAGDPGRNFASQGSDTGDDTSVDPRRVRKNAQNVPL